MVPSLRLSLLVHLVVLGGLAAQSPADRAALATTADEVGTGDPAATVMASDPMAREIQQGMVGLHSYSLRQDRPAMERALFRFNSATVRHTDWPWPEFAMAQAFLLMHEAEAPLLPSEGMREGETHLDAAWRHLREALHRDHDFMPARRVVADLAYASGDRELRDDMREALAIEVTHASPLPEALIAWSRHQRERREHELAFAVLDRAEAVGADHSVLALERARTLASLDDLPAAALWYWEGLEDLTPAGRELYRQDLEWILSEDSLASFTRLDDVNESDWLAHFWAERDAASASPPGARLVEHLRRWAYVHEHFRIPSPWTRTLYTRVDFQFDGWISCVESVPQFYERLPIKPPALPGDTRTKEPFLDHRGLIYMKHGEPFAMLTPVGAADIAFGEEEGYIVKDRFGQMTAEASMARTAIWVYWIEGAWRVLSFRGSAALGGHGPTTLSSYVRGNSAVWDALSRVIPGYAKVASRLRLLEGRLYAPIFPSTCEAEYRTALKQNRADADVGIDTDSEAPPILEPWNAALRFFGIGDASEQSARALVTFAIPVRDLVADTLESGTALWRVNFRIVAWRPSDGRRIEVDSTRRFTAVGAEGDGFLSGRFEVPLDDGSWQVAVLVRQPGDPDRGAYALRRNLVVGGDPPLSLSDIVTGRDQQPDWRAPDGPFPVNTLGTWPRGSTVEVWYEVRGLEAGATYRTTIEVIPGERRLGDPVRVASDDAAMGQTSVVRKAIGLDRLRPGSYRLVVTVEHDGARAVREQEILIVP